MDCTPGFPVHQLGLVQIHVHQVGDAIQPSHLALASGSLGVGLELRKRLLYRLAAPFAKLFVFSGRGSTLSRLQTRPVVAEVKERKKTRKSTFRYFVLGNVV